MLSLTDPDYLDKLLAQPASLSTFKDWLRRGLGRVMLHLERHDPAPYISIIEEFPFPRNRIWLCEGTREAYVVAIFDRTGEFDRLANNVIYKFSLDSGFDGYDWMLERLMVKLADRSFPKATNVLFDTFERRDVYEPEYYDEIIDLDPQRVLDIMERRLARSSNMEEWQFTVDDIVTHVFLKSRRPKKLNLTRVEAYFSNHERLLSLARIGARQYNESKQHYGRGYREKPTYDEIQAELHVAGERDRSHFSLLGGRADRITVAKVARDFANESDPKQISKYIEFFSGVRYPLHPRALIRTLNDEDEFRDLTIKALSLIRHPSIHELATQLLQEQKTVEAAQLLESNFLPEDVPQLAAAMTPETSLNDEAVHTIGYSVLKIQKRFRTKELIPALLSVYEHTPCAVCRDDALEALDKLDAVPEWIWLEDPFDCANRRFPTVNEKV